ncbi:MAG: TPM domain-containing protein [Eubacteriales bacterium]|nr:TPM domain-containing protein [Eubacteriales bacterium]
MTTISCKGLRHRIYCVIFTLALFLGLSFTCLQAATAEDSYYQNLISSTSSESGFEPYIDECDLLNEESVNLLVSVNQAIKDTGAQIVVIIVQSLGDESIEEAATGSFRSLRIGDAKKHNGLLLFVARDDRKVRIEVGYGAEGFVTDSKAGRIIRDLIIPEFKKSDFNLGIQKGVYALAHLVAKEYQISLDIDRTQYRFSKNVERQMRGVSLFSVFSVIAFIIAFLTWYFWRISRDRRLGIVRSQRSFVYMTGVVIQFAFELLLSIFSSSGSGSGRSNNSGFGGGSSGGGGASGSW